MKRFLSVFGLFVLVSCAPQRQGVLLSPVVAPIVKPFVEPIVGQIESEKTIKPQLGPQSGQPLGLPSEINLEVPFYSQAPDGNWSLPWQEACEEASAILAYHFVVGGSLDLAQHKKELNALFDWQKQHFGDYKDTTIEQTAEMIRGYWGFDRLRIVENPTVEQIKEALAEGDPVIAPFSGRDLKNPFYSNQGPYYHMLVIKGYDSTGFITNDVGTKQGHNYRYPFDHLMSALHDWDTKDIRLGAKKIIVLQR